MIPPYGRVPNIRGHRGSRVTTGSDGNQLMVGGDPHVSEVGTYLAASTTAKVWVASAYLMWLKVQSIPTGQRCLLL